MPRCTSCFYQKLQYLMIPSGYSLNRESILMSRLGAFNFNVYLSRRISSAIYRSSLSVTGVNKLVKGRENDTHIQRPIKQFARDRHICSHTENSTTPSIHHKCVAISDCLRISGGQRNLCTSASSNHESSNQSSKGAGQTYDAQEVDKFSKLSEGWWDQYGEFQALHSLNALRVPLVRDALSLSEVSSTPKPLDGLNIVDVGCGGGILSEPLSRLGANVTGVDASLPNIITAENHSKHDPSLEGKLNYKCCLVEELAVEYGPVFDAVVASEIVEHVADPRVFVRACCDLLKPGGSAFFTTMNRTAMAYGLAVFAAEKILRIVPDGAHDWNKFVTPEELSDMLQQSGASTRLVHGMILNPFTLRWSWCSDTSMNYAIHAIKHSEES